MVELFLTNLVAYLISLAAGERSAAIAAAREAKIKDALNQEEKLRNALASISSIRDEIRSACVELARNRTHLGVQKHEQPLWDLLNDEVFQDDLSEWLIAGDIETEADVKSLLLAKMASALDRGGANTEEIDRFTSDYFQVVEKSVLSHPVLANWRQQLCLDFLRQQATVTRRYVEAASGVFPKKKKEAALNRYCEIALSTWDIIDLSNLPEGDVQIATQRLLLRQLYMPLRVHVAPSRGREDAYTTLTKIEKARETKRHQEAGHFLPNELDFPESTSSGNARSPVGERLFLSRRLMVLGDPGGGKTTMLRWMATAYLLRYKGDLAAQQIPDTDTLPKQPWIPVLIRCRDLGDVDLCRSFSDVLAQHLNKTELLPSEADVMRAVILDLIEKGEVLLLIDGLDEITDPKVRTQFCQQLENTVARYPTTPIVVTSRIVGYRDMPYRLRSGFEHVVVAELSRQDKDLFARRWVEVTEPHQGTSEKAKRVHELIDALHSNNRIERLTGNPMLLTAMALVKRKVGKLPSRRNKLYAEAVSVLLNWNPRSYPTIEEEEALPQLEYVAYAMCQRGVQRLTDDEILSLLEKLRQEYPNKRALRSREPREFLSSLEQRSSILIRSGGAWDKNDHVETSLWEFRHLTFQEYLASQALLKGHYPGRGKPTSLAKEVAPLAGTMTNVGQTSKDIADIVDVSESWKEAIRLLVAGCNDDDVDEVLLAILTPMNGEDVRATGGARAALAAHCLIDEPNVSENVVKHVLNSFADKASENYYNGSFQIRFDQVLTELADSIWSNHLKLALTSEFVRRPSLERFGSGALWGIAEYSSWNNSHRSITELFNNLLQRLDSGDQVETISAALTLMEIASSGNVEIEDHFSARLLKLLTSDDLPTKHAAAIALGYFSQFKIGAIWPYATWIATGWEVKFVIETLESLSDDEICTGYWLMTILGYSGDRRAYRSLVLRLNDPNTDVRGAAIGALGRLGDKRAVPPLIDKLDEQDTDVCLEVITALGRLGGKLAVVPLLAKLEEEDIDLHFAVIEALGLLGDKRGVPKILAKLNSQSFSIRLSALHVLAQLKDSRAVVPLLSGMDNHDSRIRAGIARALGAIGDKRAVEPLISRLDDPVLGVRIAVIEALGELGDERAVGHLYKKIDAPRTTELYYVIEALRKFGHKQIVGPLLALLNETSGFGVIHALGTLGDQRAVEPLVSELNDGDEDVVISVIQSLGALGDERAVLPLLAKIDDEDTRVRTEVIEALAALGDKRAVAPLLAKLADDTEQLVRVTAAVALCTLKELNGVAQLSQFFASDNSEIRRFAVRAYAVQRDITDQRLLSLDLDGRFPWLDPIKPVSEAHIYTAAKQLKLSAKHVRSRFEAMSSEIKIKLGWKKHRLSRD